MLPCFHIKEVALAKYGMYTMQTMSEPFKLSEQECREAVKILAERNGITRVDEVYEDGETLMSRAAGCESYLDLLRLLIAAGADANAVDAQGCTALDTAEAAGSGVCARLLRQAGGRTGSGDPLSRAVAMGDTASVQELVSTHKYSQTKLQRAAGNACIADNAGMLKQLCPLLSNSKPGDGRFLAYLVRMAAWKDSRACLEYLLGDFALSPDGDEGRLDAPDPECWFEVDDETEELTPLACAASAGHAECVRLLLHYGATPDMEDDIEETPLEAAEEMERKECAKLIREAMG